MPELPEVESLTRAVRLLLEGRRLETAKFLRADLRAPIPIEQFRAMFEGEVIEQVFRRSKYMLIRSRKGYGVFHLGMSGRMVERAQAEPQVKHTHAVFRIAGDSGPNYLHFIDPRRFGRIGCVELNEYTTHDFFIHLGPEPLDHPALGLHLYQLSRGRSGPIKPFLMDATNVVGVGNIYASEALFRAGIHPMRKAGSVSKARYELLGLAIQETLQAAIAAGGTTLRDFRTPDGKPGYFVVSLNVYDRAGKPCPHCEQEIRQMRQAGRSTFYCAVCQT